MRVVGLARRLEVPTHRAFAARCLAAIARVETGMALRLVAQGGRECARRRCATQV
jgi:hypothetical protein